VALQRVMIAVTAAAVLLQGAGFYMQIVRHQDNGAVRDGLATLPVDIVVTNGKYLPAEAASLDDKIFLYAKDEAALLVLLNRFGEEGVTEFAVVPLAFVPLPVPTQVGDLEVREKRPFVYELSE
jgi:hypothetical protein